MALLNFGNCRELIRELVEPFGLRLFGHALVHICPFVVLARGSHLQRFVQRGHFAAMQRFEPKLGVLFLVFSRLGKDCRNLLVSGLFRDRRKIGVLVSCLRFACKRVL
ncbi:hypothetical protein SDC9_159426 [bioreactor metagenome]|uniref:Uncharacterized protein n=1 Tax=bioreactor metagenome TaxID=1076179 RepID=A0A645FI27_9ZZZZ